MVRNALSLLFVFAIADFGVASELLVDDFQTGAPFVLNGPDTIVQTRLDPSSVAGGVRSVSAIRDGDTIQLLESGGIEFTASRAGGYGARFEYGSEQPLDIDLEDSDLDRFVLFFSSVDARWPFIANVTINLPPRSSDNWLSFSSALDSLGDRGRIEFLLSDVPTSTDRIDSIIIDLARFSGRSLVLDSAYLASEPIAGDYNRDGSVDELDYQEWLRLEGGTSFNGALIESYLTADGNYDGRVDAADLAIWQESFDALSVVPEPSSHVLWVLAITVAATQRKRAA